MCSGTTCVTISLIWMEWDLFIVHHGKTWLKIFFSCPFDPAASYTRYKVQGLLHTGVENFCINHRFLPCGAWRNLWLIRNISALSQCACVPNHTESMAIILWACCTYIFHWWPDATCFENVFFIIRATVVFQMSSLWFWESRIIFLRRYLQYIRRMMTFFLLIDTIWRFFIRPSYSWFL